MLGQVSARRTPIDKDSEARGFDQKLSRVFLESTLTRTHPKSGEWVTVLRPGTLRSEKAAEVCNLIKVAPESGSLVFCASESFSLFEGLARMSQATISRSVANAALATDRLIGIGNAG